MTLAPHQHGALVPAVPLVGEVPCSRRASAEAPATQSLQRSLTDYNEPRVKPNRMERT